MSNIVPQPQITFENNKIYIDSPVDVKYTLDGLDPVFYGLIYTSPISISHTTTIKAISVNSLGEMSNVVAGTFTPESDVSDGSSDSSWIPVTYTYILNPSPGGGADLSNYTTYSYINSYYTSYSYINANYTTFSYLEDKNYATEQYVNDAIDNIEFPEPDLSSYVTKTELSSCSYITMGDVSACGYITESDVAQMGYITSIPSEYITQTELSTCGYITANDITIPVIDENLIPKENNTYTLGDSNHQYSTAYISTIKLNNYENQFYGNGQYNIGVSINGSTRLNISAGALIPQITNYDLGTSSNKFKTTYTENLYSTYIAGTTYVSSYQAMYFGTDRPWCLYGSGGGSTEETILTNKSSAGKWFRVKDYYGNNILGIYEINNAGNKVEIPAATYISNLYTENVSYTSGKSKILMNDRNLDFYANNNKIINLSDYNGLVPIKTNVNLGGSSNKWGSTYTTDLYADNIHNFIWTGTSAEYAALDNYTSYQIYLIKES